MALYFSLGIDVSVRQFASPCEERGTGIEGCSTQTQCSTHSLRDARYKPQKGLFFHRDCATHQPFCPCLPVEVLIDPDMPPSCLPVKQDVYKHLVVFLP